MNSDYENRKERALPASSVVLVVVVVLLGLGLAGVLLQYVMLKTGNFAFPLLNGQNGPTRPTVEATTVPTEEPTEEPAEETEPPHTGVVRADGDPSGVLCRESYTVSAEAEAASRVVARAGGAELTNGMLQLAYLNQISAFRASEQAVSPDFTQPLELQSCPLTDGRLSWQHYFLERAVKSWQLQQAMLYAASQPQKIREEAYKPNETTDLHGEYVSPELPVNNFLYQDLPCYQPNEMHQAYLDGLEEMLEGQVQALGYSSLQDYAQTVFGDCIGAEALVSAARDYNLSYFYFTENSYYVAPTDDAVESYLQAHRDELAFEDGRTVDLSHILLIPEGATVAPDGTVTATEGQWKTCMAKAEQTLQSWQWSYQTSRNAESNFARTANQVSQDEGSRLNGGYYRQIRQGQLTEALDAWLFGSERKVGDTGVIPSSVGCHVVYVSGIYENSFQAARAALVLEQEQALWEEFAEKADCSADYSAAAVWVDCNQKVLNPTDALYPDVAHERFPSAIVYFQQDYMYHRYGGSYVGRGGCGITTMAMLSTYMADTIYSPAMLADRYPYYHDASGTNGDIFLYATADLGYYTEKQTASLEEAIAALKDGRVVISLQQGGHFTSGGHYLLLQRYYEETDTFQVRDSNIYNYGKLKGHQVDSFTRADILSGNSHFYIMQAKIRRIPACARCGGEMEQKPPAALLNEDYICEKCSAAMERRENFLAISERLLP